MYRATGESSGSTAHEVINVELQEPSLGHDSSGTPLGCQSHRSPPVQQCAAQGVALHDIPEATANLCSTSSTQGLLVNRAVVQLEAHSSAEVVTCDVPGALKPTEALGAIHPIGRADVRRETAITVESTEATPQETLATVIATPLEAPPIDQSHRPPTPVHRRAAQSMTMHDIPEATNQFRASEVGSRSTLEDAASAHVDDLPLVETTIGAETIIGLTETSPLSGPAAVTDIMPSAGLEAADVEGEPDSGGQCCEANADGRAGMKHEAAEKLCSTSSTQEALVDDISTAQGATCDAPGRIPPVVLESGYEGTGCETVVGGESTDATPQETVPSPAVGVSGDGSVDILEGPTPESSGDLHVVVATTTVNDAEEAGDHPQTTDPPTNEILEEPVPLEPPYNTPPVKPWVQLLPPEILLNIFRMIFHGPQTPSYSSLEANMQRRFIPERVANVCSYWDAVTSMAAEFWDREYVVIALMHDPNPTTRLRRYLEKTKPSTNFRLRVWSGVPWNLDKMDKEERLRFDKEYAERERQRLMELVPLIDEYSPRLRSLNIVTVFPTSLPDPTTLFTFNDPSVHPYKALYRFHLCSALGNTETPQAVSPYGKQSESLYTRYPIRISQHVQETSENLLCFKLSGSAFVSFARNWLTYRRGTSECYARSMLEYHHNFDLAITHVYPSSGGAEPFTLEEFLIVYRMFCGRALDVILTDVHLPVPEPPKDIEEEEDNADASSAKSDSGGDSEPGPSGSNSSDPDDGTPNPAPWYAWPRCCHDGRHSRWSNIEMKDVSMAVKYGIKAVLQPHLDAVKIVEEVLEESDTEVAEGFAVPGTETAPSGAQDNAQGANDDGLPAANPPPLDPTVPTAAGNEADGAPIAPVTDLNADPTAISDNLTTEPTVDADNPALTEAAAETTTIDNQPRSEDTSPANDNSLESQGVQENTRSLETPIIPPTPPTTESSPLPVQACQDEGNLTEETPRPETGADQPLSETALLPPANPSLAKEPSNISAGTSIPRPLTQVEDEDPNPTKETPDGLERPNVVSTHQVGFSMPEGELVGTSQLTEIQGESTTPEVDAVERQPGVDSVSNAALNEAVESPHHSDEPGANAPAVAADIASGSADVSDAKASQGEEGQQAPEASRGEGRVEPWNIAEPPPPVVRLAEERDVLDAPPAIEPPLFARVGVEPEETPGAQHVQGQSMDTAEANPDAEAERVPKRPRAKVTFRRPLWTLTWRDENRDETAQEPLIGQKDGEGKVYEWTTPVSGMWRFRENKGT